MSTLRVMTFNMLHAPGDRLGPLVEVVREVAPDVLACQEINTLDGLLALARELDMLPVWGVANSHEDTRDGEPLFEHVAILTRMAPVAVKVHPGDRRAMFRPVLEATLQVPDGTRVTVCTLHLRAVVDPTERFLEFREIGAVLGAVAGAPAPVVLLGDFNALAPDECKPGSRSRPGAPEDYLAALEGGVIGAVLDAGLVDSYRLVNPFDGTPESTLAAREGARVDYVFVDRQLAGRVERSFIVPGETVGRASDHLPVVTELRWPD